MIYEATQLQEENRNWAGKLLECMENMGKQHTNPVLLTLEDIGTIKPYQRYPSEPYHFGNGSWRAFYHSHESPIADEREHGHFHFFTRSHDESEWGHVIACGADKFGQPISLFTTNLWVTDGQWFYANHLPEQIRKLRDSSDEILPLTWFKYFLLLLSQKIQGLLDRRDQEINRLYPRRLEDCFRDREIYYLSLADINLERTLLTSLNH